MLDTSFRSSRVFKRSLLVAGLCLFCAAGASALDIADVKSLVKNQVPETVVVNMVQQGGGIAMANEDLLELRALGASENLIAIVASKRVAPAAATVSPGEYVQEDGTLSSYPSGTSAYAESGTPYTYIDPETGQTYTQTYDPSVTYADPNVYYEVPASPTVIYQSPTVIETPTYVVPGYPVYDRGPSWGFSIGIGKSWGGRGRDRWYGGRGGRRPHRRR